MLRRLKTQDLSVAVCPRAPCGHSLLIDLSLLTVACNLPLKKE